MIIHSRHVVLAALLLSGCHAFPDGGDDALAESTVCATAHRTSRWVSRDSSYRFTAQYGEAEDEQILDVWGSGRTSGGDVLFFDAGSSRVLRFDGQLELVDAFGRSGRGPGEFVYARSSHGNWMSVNDSLVYVMDLRSISIFTDDGRFLRYATQSPPFPAPILGIAPQDGRLVYARDTINFDDGSRALETWRLDSVGDRVRLRSDEMPQLPRWRGRLVRGAFADQGEPLWVVQGSCALLSDGASDWLLRINLESNTADTVFLPTRPIPVRTRADERRMDAIRRTASAVGMSAGSSEMKPTARWKWNALVMDPDGFVWLEPWRPHSMRYEPLAAWVLNPSTGSLDSMSVPAFPRAFMGVGEYVALEFDPELLIPILRKYQLEPSKGTWRP